MVDDIDPDEAVVAVADVVTIAVLSLSRVSIKCADVPLTNPVVAAVNVVPLGLTLAFAAAAAAAAAAK